MLTKSDAEKYMHVCLGRGHDGVQKIILHAPYHLGFETVTCKLSSPGLKSIELTCPATHDLMRTFQFHFSDLMVGTEYTYQFIANDSPLDLGQGLHEKDLKFKYWHSLDDTSEVALVSCNGVYKFEPQEKKWDMWERLQKVVTSSGQPPKLIIHGGDQYYQDDTEKEYYKKLSGEISPQLRDELKAAAIRRIWEQTSNLSYRKLMASTPSVAMLDDHDITDGAGGIYVDEKGVFEPAYLNYRAVLVEVFEAFQATRNPEPILKKENAAYSFSLDLGGCALIALDMRTEKNARLCKVMESDHQAAVLEKITSLPHKNVLILSPVVPIRNSQDLEGAMTGLAKLCKIEAVQNWFGRIHRSLKSLIEFIAGMEDDLEDALSSPCGLPFFQDLIISMSKNARTGTKYTLLSGDIHTGGSVEMHATVENFNFSVPIIVSSPIGYDPMPKVVEGLLQESTMVDIKRDNCRIVGVPNQFFTHRNFILLTPFLLNTLDINSASKIYVEGVAGFRYLPLSLWNPGETEGQKTLTKAPVFTEKDKQLEI